MYPGTRSFVFGASGADRVRRDKPSVRCLKEISMAHVITDACIKCMNCTNVCPVTCIHPMDGEEKLDEVPQLYINPDECIHCGACAPECPVDAIFPEEDLPADKQQFIETNADFYK
jgi:ferredoxin